MQNLIGIALCHLLVEISEKSKLIYLEKNALQDIHNAELLNLQQASIALSLLSTKLSSAMINEIRACVKKGSVKIAKDKLN